MLTNYWHLKDYEFSSKMVFKKFHFKFIQKWIFASVWSLKQNKWSKSLNEKMRKQVVDVGKLKWYTAQPLMLGGQTIHNAKTIIIFWLLYMIGYLWMLWPQNRNWRRNVISMTSIFITHLNSQFGFETSSRGALRFMPSDAKSWKTRTVIIKCRYLHLLASSTSCCCIDAITKIHSTWFEYSHLLGKILRQERDEKLTLGMGVLNEGTDARCEANVAPPACLVALILIPHGAAFLDGFSMRNVISGDFCVAHWAHWRKILSFTRIRNYISKNWIKWNAIDYLCAFDAEIK